MRNRFKVVPKVLKNKDGMYYTPDGSLVKFASRAMLVGDVNPSFVPIHPAPTPCYLIGFRNDILFAPESEALVYNQADLEAAVVYKCGDKWSIKFEVGHRALLKKHGFEDYERAVLWAEQWYNENPQSREVRSGY